MTIPPTLKKAAISRFWLVVILAIAFGYVEAAVVVYLRQIFHPAGFVFPLTSFPLIAESNRILLVEVGREAATIVLIFAACFLAGQNRRQRFAFFMIIFAIWDIFYYVWLKVILDWPASITEWDVLFLMPCPWAGPVLAPVLVSLTMLVFATLIFYRDCLGKPVRISLWDWLGFLLSSFMIVVSFCIAGQYMQSSDYAGHFSWPIFTIGLLGVIMLSVKCYLKRE
ncbi:MAG: hypothetical protein ABSG97_09140 [Sedimentisphaerales bacterium]